MSLIVDLLVVIGALYALLLAALIVLAADEWRQR